MLERFPQTALLPIILSIPLAHADGQDRTLRPVPFDAVRIGGEFWGPRLESNRAATIPHAFAQCEATGRLANFARAGGLEEGGHQGYYFNDSDVYKLIEGASYSLAIDPDPELRSFLDGLIAKISAAQEGDGYLYTARILQEPGKLPPGGTERWSEPGGHELYCFGHLYEAAVAHHAATGEDSLLAVARKNADLVCSTFGPGKAQDWPPGHQEIELGLARLYRATGERRYLEQARWFLDIRGRERKRGLYGTYSQDHVPVIEQSEAVGHAVRALYQYAGMAEVAALMDAPGYLPALERIWEDVVGRKLYLTGGIGAAGGHEGFGQPFELPNLVAYGETCAAIASVFWNHRMFLHRGEVKYIDVLERVLYNGLLSGVSLDGKAFFYPNPLESDGRHARHPWFGCACCPSNVPRFLAALGQYVYAQRGDELFANLYVAGEAQVELAGQRVKITQRTRYPWDGEVVLEIAPEQPAEFALKLRIPGWAREEPVPGELYRFLRPSATRPVVRVSGVVYPVEPEEGYLVLRRRWSAGDAIHLELPMPVRRVVADQRVAENRGKVALQRGPLVYCVEGADIAGGHVIDLLLSDEERLAARERPELLGGLTVIEGAATSTRWLLTERGRQMVRSGVAITAIPYCAWAHRGRGEMSVWIARQAHAARPRPAPTLASRARASTSGGDARALNDQLEPRSSGDHANRFLHWWPRKGTREWVQYDFPAPARIAAVEVYWFDDTGRGECRLPASWRLLYRTGDGWQAVENPSAYGCVGDGYNRTTFEPVTTSALRLEVQLPERFSTGIHEWRVEKAGD